MAVVLKIRRDVVSAWNYYNPILHEAELGLELDTHRFKFGDGKTRWEYLPYANTGDGIFEQLSAVSSQIFELSSSTSASFNDLSAYGEAISGLTISVKTLSEDYNDLSANLNDVSATLTNHISASEADITSIKANINTLSSDTASLKITTENLQFGIDTNTQSINEISAAVSASLGGVTPDVSAVSSAINELSAQTAAKIEELSADLATADLEIDTISASLSGKADVVHIHEISDVIGLQAALDDKASVESVNDLTLNKADRLHTHSMEDVTGLVDELNNRALANHVHDISGVTGLQDKLDDVVYKSGVNYVPTGLQISSDADQPNLVFTYSSDEPEPADPIRIELSKNGIAVVYADGSTVYELLSGSDNQIARMKDISSFLDAAVGPGITITNPEDGGENDIWTLTDGNLNHNIIFRLDKAEDGTYVSTRYPSVLEVSGLLTTAIKAHNDSPDAHDGLFEGLSSYAKDLIEEHDSSPSAHADLINGLSSTISSNYVEIKKDISDLSASINEVSSNLLTDVSSQISELSSDLSDLSAYSISSISSNTIDIDSVSSDVTIISAILEDLAERQIDQNEFRWVNVIEGISAKVDLTDDSVIDSTGTSFIDPDPPLNVYGFSFVPNAFDISVPSAATAVSIKYLSFVLTDQGSYLERLKNRPLVIAGYRKEGGAYYQNGKSINRVYVDETSAGQKIEFYLQNTVFENAENSYFQFMTFDDDEPAGIPIKLIECEESENWTTYSSENFEGVYSLRFPTLEMRVNAVNDIADSLNAASSSVRVINNVSAGPAGGFAQYYLYLDALSAIDDSKEVYAQYSDDVKKPLATKEYAVHGEIDFSQSSAYVRNETNLDDIIGGGIYYVEGFAPVEGQEDNFNGRPVGNADGTLTVVFTEASGVYQTFVAMSPKPETSGELSGRTDSLKNMMYIRQGTLSDDKTTYEWTDWVKAGSELGVNDPPPWWEEAQNLPIG